MLITIPKALREILGEEGSEGLIELLNGSSQNTHDSVSNFLAERFERRLSEEIGTLRKEMAEQIEGLRSEMTEQNAALRSEFSERDANLRSEFAEEIAGLRSEFSEQLARQKGELLEEIAKVREEIHTNQATTIRWMFLFWVGQIGAMLGILFAFFD